MNFFVVGALPIEWHHHMNCWPGWEPGIRIDNREERDREVGAWVYLRAVAATTSFLPSFIHSCKTDPRLLPPLFSASHDWHACKT